MRAKIQILLQLILETPVPEVTRVLLQEGCPVALIPSYVVVSISECQWFDSLSIILL
jgi:hypothetical protein